MNTIKQLEFLQSMATTRRYSQTKMIIEENILEHSAFVGVTSVMLASEYNHLQEGQIDAKLADLGQIALRSLFHDMEEGKTGDITRDVKYSSPEATRAFEKIAEEGIKRVLSELELSNKTEEMIYGIWKHAKDDFDGLFVKLADAAAVTFKLWSETLVYGNRALLLVCQGVGNYMDKCLEFIRSECDASTPGYWFLVDYVENLKKVVVAAESQRIQYDFR